MLQLDKIVIMDAPETLDLKFFRHFLSPRANGGIRTLHLRIMSRVFVTVPPSSNDTYKYNCTF